MKDSPHFQIPGFKRRQSGGGGSKTGSRYLPLKLQFNSPDEQGPSSHVEDAGSCRLPVTVFEPKAASTPQAPGRASSSRFLPPDAEAMVKDLVRSTLQEFFGDEHRPKRRALQEGENGSPVLQTNVDDRGHGTTAMSTNQQQSSESPVVPERCDATLGLSGDAPHASPGDEGNLTARICTVTVVEVIRQGRKGKHAPFSVKKDGEGLTITHEKEELPEEWSSNAIADFSGTSAVHDVSQQDLIFNSVAGAPLASLVIKGDKEECKFPKATMTLPNGEQVPVLKKTKLDYLFK